MSRRAVFVAIMAVVAGACSPGAPPPGPAAVGTPSTPVQAAPPSVAPSATPAVPRSAAAPLSPPGGPLPGFLHECLVARIGNAGQEVEAGKRAPTAAEAPHVAACLAIASPAPQTALPKLMITGDIPCGPDTARAWFARFYPALVSVMGEPFTFASEGLTWWWDTTSGHPGHGWDPKTYTIRFPPGEAHEQGLSGSELCQQVYKQFIRETAHLFYVVGHADLNFGPQWLRQANVNAALGLVGTEPAGGPSFLDYDVIQNAGRERVNGVRSNGQKYGDDLGSSGRSTVDASAGQALMMLVQILSYDTGDDLLKRINSAILARWKASGSPELPPTTYAQILNELSRGRTIDGLPPGDWLLAQPFTNAEGAPGRYLAVLPLGRCCLVAAYERTVLANGDRKETPLAGLDVKVSLLDTTGAVRATSAAAIPPKGDVAIAVDALAQGMAPGAYMVRAEASGSGIPSATNVVLVGPPGTDDELLIVPLNADGTAIRADIISQLKVTGALSTDTSRKPGVLSTRARPGTNVELSLGSFHATLTKPVFFRLVPLRIP